MGAPASISGDLEGSPGRVEVGFEEEKEISVVYYQRLHPLKPAVFSKQTDLCCVEISFNSGRFPGLELRTVMYS